MGSPGKLAVTVFAVVLLAGGSAHAGQATLAPAVAALPPNLVKLIAAAGGKPADSDSPRYAYLGKLDNSLQILANNELRGRPLETGAAALNPAPKAGGTLLQGAGAELSSGDVLIDVYVDDSVTETANTLRALGMRVRAVNGDAPQRLVEGWLPASALTDAARLPAARALVAVPAENTNAGSVLSQGDAAHNGPTARALGPTGAGVKVGIISDSINRVGSGVAGSQATGNLPANVQVLLDGNPGESADEGRAMAEIVYDEAPGITNMYFTTGQGAATRAAGIDNLIAQGVKVIADDTFQMTEPFFQDGQIAQAVDRAHAAGVTYLVSAGNRAKQSWEGTYAPIADPRAISPSTEDFDPGPGVDHVQTLGTYTNKAFFLELQWDEAWGKAATDLALDIYSINAGVPNFAFTVDTNNITSGLPSEFAQISVSGTATVGIGIRRVSGSRNPFMKYILGGVPTGPIAEYPTNSSAIDPDASSAKGALTIAASNFATPTTPEAFSSRGPTITRFFDTAGNRLATPEVRAKPNLAAADGVATSVTGFSSFFGTSAAAPSAAGIAALMRSANPNMPIAAMDAILTNPANAIDCTLTPGVPDLDCGIGFILADKAVTQALDSTTPAIGPALTPATPNGANGYYVSDVAVGWNVSDPNSPIIDRTNCGSTAVTSDGTVALTCSATSAGGTGSATVTVKRDASPPSTPVFTKIKAKKYLRKKLPKKKKIQCVSSDSISGIASCTVTGFKTKKGKHTLTATATNGAGLTATAKLKYRVR